MGKFLTWLEGKTDTKEEKKGYIKNIEDITFNNKNFRKVLYTAEHCQLVVMSLKPNEDIGEEIHKVDQFFRIESGIGEVIINGIKSPLKNGSAIIIPAGAKHNIINSGSSEMKLYTIYSPPHHKNGIVHKTKNDAKKDKENFNGKTTE